jgi:hypothetical protein
MVGEYPFGLDEQYLNHTLLPYMIQQKFRIGIAQQYYLCYSLAYYMDILIGTDSMLAVCTEAI